MNHKHSFLSFRNVIHKQILVFFLYAPLFLPKLSPNWIEKLSFYNPFVNENGRSISYSLSGSYVIRAYVPKSPTTRLGNVTGPTSGSIVSKQRLGVQEDNFSSNFRVELNLIVDKGCPDSFIVFAFTRSKPDFSNIKNGPISYEGILLSLFTQEKNPVIGCDIGNKEKYHINVDAMQYKKELKNSLYNNSSNFRFENINGIFKVYMAINNRDWVELFRINNAEIDRSFFSVHGVNRSTGSVKFEIVNVMTYDLKSLAQTTQETQDAPRKRGWLVWIIFFVVLGAIVYYLIRNGSSPFSLDKKRVS